VALALRSQTELVSEVFKTVGQPTVTYVERENGLLEAQLKNALRTSWQLCLITGPSKTGKTTLYKRVLYDLKKAPLIVRCDRELETCEFWSRALESINFSRLRELHSERKLESKLVATLGAKLGWSWLAEASGQLSAETAAGMSEAKAREAVLSKPSPMHLIPALRKLPYVLVVEDYHYLPENTQQTIFQQWKHFVDEEVSVIVIGTTHHAIDIINANPDLMARKIHVEIPSWSNKDLCRIARQGFDFLGVEIPRASINRIANESVGLPIVTQHVCEQMFRQEHVFEHRRDTAVPVDANAVEKACEGVARTKFSELRQYYDRLITGPRKRARKFDTYELVLSCFALEPLTFQLAKHDIIDRLSKLPIPENRMPPIGSLNSMLNALEQFQKLQKFDLLEWRKDENKLYMIEPSFLFFVRWGIGRPAGGVGSTPKSPDDTRWVQSLLEVLIGDEVAKRKVVKSMTIKYSRDEEWRKD
jgi:hypothetical protein